MSLRPHDTTIAAESCSWISRLVCPRLCGTHGVIADTDYLDDSFVRSPCWSIGIHFDCIVVRPPPLLFRSDWCQMKGPSAGQGGMKALEQRRCSRLVWKRGRMNVRRGRRAGKQRGRQAGRQDRRQARVEIGTTGAAGEQHHPLERRCDLSYIRYRLADSFVTQRSRLTREKERRRSRRRSIQKRQKGRRTILRRWKNRGCDDRLVRSNAHDLAPAQHGFFGCSPWQQRRRWEWQQQ